MTLSPIDRLIALTEDGAGLNIDDFRLRFETGPYLVMEASPIVLKFLAGPVESSELSSILETLKRTRGGSLLGYDLGTPGESLPDLLAGWISDVEDYFVEGGLTEGDLEPFEFNELDTYNPAESQPSPKYMPNRIDAVPSLTLGISYGNSAFCWGILLERRSHDVLSAAEVLAAITLARIPFKRDNSFSEFPVGSSSSWVPSGVANHESQKVHILVIGDQNVRILHATLSRSWLRFIAGKSTGSNVPRVTFTMSDPVSLLDLCNREPMAKLITTMLCGWGPGTNKNSLGIS